MKLKFEGYVSKDEHQETKKELEELREQKLTFDQSQKELKSKIITLAKERELALADHSNAKKDKQQLSITLALQKDQLKQTKFDMDKQEMEIQDSMKDIEKKLKDEIEQKMVFQKEAMENTHLAKILEQENVHRQSELEELSIES